MPRLSLSDAERAERRGHLLAAAHRLYRERRELPTVAEIAEAAGVAKGTVYLSFGTKESIFIALLEDSFGQLLGAAMPLLRQLPSNPPETAEAFARLYSEQIAALPDLLPLAAITNAVLEKNLPLDAMLEFKRAVHRAMDEAGALLERRLRTLPTGAGAELLMRTWALTLGLWQSIDCPEPIRKHLERSPEQPLASHLLGHDFAAELAIMVRQFWMGALQDPRPPRARQQPSRARQAPKRRRAK